MRIAIDARMMGPLNTRGIGRYTEELIRSLLGLLSEQDRLILLVRDPSTSPFQGYTQVEHRKADIQWYSWREQVWIPGLLKATRADIVHIPHWNVPLLYRGPLVLTIHDLLLRHEDAKTSAKASTRHPIYLWIKRLGHRLTLSHAVHQAKLICVPTQYVARDVQRFYPNASSPLVTSEGLSVLPKPTTQKFPYAPFLFYVGSAYPHKRLDLLLEAWPSLSERYPELHLVLGGELDVFMKRHQEYVLAQRLSRVHFLGRLTDQKLADHYAHASAFVFPSSHEGFGLPPLEALSYGCPVIASDATCLPEVLPKDGVFFFQNGSMDGMIAAIEQVLTHPTEASAAAQRGRMAVGEQYQWKEVARKTLTGYRSLIETRL